MVDNEDCLQSLKRPEKTKPCAKPKPDLQNEIHLQRDTLTLPKLNRAPEYRLGAWCSTDKCNVASMFYVGSGVT